MSPDPLEVVGFVGIWCALAGALVGGWVAAVELYAWRARRRVRRSAAEPPPLVLSRADWAPEWEADWPQT